MKASHLPMCQALILFLVERNSEKDLQPNPDTSFQKIVRSQLH